MKLYLQNGERVIRQTLTLTATERLTGIQGYLKLNRMDKNRAEIFHTTDLP